MTILNYNTVKAWVGVHPACGRVLLYADVHGNLYVRLVLFPDSLT